VLATGILEVPWILSGRLPIEPPTKCKLVMDPFGVLLLLFDIDVTLLLDISSVAVHWAKTLVII
jgi:hypothetical protein